jgi:hypothetical protein
LVSLIETGARVVAGAVFSIHRRMLFEAKVQDVVYNGPAGFQVPGELKRPRPVTNQLKWSTYTYYCASAMECFIPALLEI